MLNDGKNPNSRSSINQIEITDLMLDNNSILPKYETENNKSRKYEKN